jgi:ribosomal protein S18 acetylase RimI-like enzyme
LPAPKNVPVPASNYSYQELADIYNQTRIDYIVPMPMNAQRMKEYVEHYDVNLQSSVVATREDGTPLGIGMLGVRGDRTWITRLGVVPNQRERRVGSFLMEHVIKQSRLCNAKWIQLEVIIGNEPARKMFEKYGFEPTRELLVIRRPPRPHVPGTHPLVHELNQLGQDEIVARLADREPGASWVEDTPSLLNGGNLKGISLRLGDGSEGWAVFMATRFQLQHIVMKATPQYDENVMFGLLYYIHEFYPNRDTKVENIPLEHPSMLAYNRLGYVVSFRRTEMVLDLGR